MYNTQRSLLDRVVEFKNSNLDKFCSLACSFVEYQGLSRFKGKNIPQGAVD